MVPSNDGDDVANTVREQQDDEALARSSRARPTRSGFRVRGTGCGNHDSGVDLVLPPEPRTPNPQCHAPKGVASNEPCWIRTNDLCLKGLSGGFRKSNVYGAFR